MDKHKKGRNTGEGEIMPASYVRKQDTLYVVEHEMSEVAKETVIEKIRKLGSVKSNV